jgi:hypothetical protein
MKKAILFALLLATFTAAAAQAQEGPRMGVLYYCDYSDNYTGDAVDMGWSFWQRRPGSTATLLYTHETFETSWGSDTYKATWSNPVVVHPLLYTQWKFAFNPYGPQCAETRVWPGALTIQFLGCTDGHTRVCRATLP